MSTLYTHSEVKPPSNALDNLETRLNSTPSHVIVREKPEVSRSRAAHPTSLPLPLEEHPPRKRIRSYTVAANLEHSAQDTSKPPTPTRNDHSGKTLTGHFTRTNYLAPTFLVANSLTPNSQFGEMTHHFMDAICEPSSLPDAQEIVSILLSCFK